MTPRYVLDTGILTGLRKGHTRVVDAERERLARKPSARRG